MLFAFTVRARGGSTEEARCKGDAQRFGKAPDLQLLHQFCTIDFVSTQADLQGERDDLVRLSLDFEDRNLISFHQPYRLSRRYSTDTILILGKRPSVDAIGTDAFAGSPVIEVNDAERIVPTDITLFHAGWVKPALIDNGLRSRLYITLTVFGLRVARCCMRPSCPCRMTMRIC